MVFWLTLFPSASVTVVVCVRPSDVNSVLTVVVVSLLSEDDELLPELPDADDELELLAVVVPEADAVDAVPVVDCRRRQRIPNQKAFARPAWCESGCG